MRVRRTLQSLLSPSGHQIQLIAWQMCSWMDAGLDGRSRALVRTAGTAIEKKGIRLKGIPLYLDMQATTPLDPRVLDTMLPYMTDQVCYGI